MMINIVEEGLIEFGSLTCPKVSLSDIKVLHFADSFDYETFVENWKIFRNEPQTIRKYGECGGYESKNIVNEERPEYKLLKSTFLQFINNDNDVTLPYYLCFCKENGDEFLLRRSLPNDKYTTGKFMTLNCEFSKAADCIPRNKLKDTREANNVDGEYILVIVHAAGDVGDREKLKEDLDKKRNDNFTLI